MRVFSIDSVDPSPELIARAGERIRAGGLVAFPTETVYGLGASLFDESAVRKVFAAKGRPSSHPLIAHVLDALGARSLAGAWPSAADDLARAFWPGPLTLVVPVADHVSRGITGGGDSIALRAPRHPVARALLASAGVPIVAPSANRYQSLSPTLAVHVAASLRDVDVWVLDGGACAGGIESTVVDVRSSPAQVLRPGAIDLDALRSVVTGAVCRQKSVPSEEIRASPGMDPRHYAPRTPLFLALTRAAAIAQARVLGGALVTFGPCEKATRALSEEPDRAAHELYATLHALDTPGCPAIVVEMPPGGARWEAILDRLTRAAREK